MTEEPEPLETVRPDLPPGLVAIVNKMMAKKPRARYQTARELLKDIARLRESLQTATGCVSLETAPEEVSPAEETEELLPFWKHPVFRWGLALGVPGLLALVCVVALLTRRPAPSREVTPAIVQPAPPNSGVPGGDEQHDRLAFLNKVVDQYLNDNPPKPSGIDACIELGVLYLNQGKTSEAEALFKRMDERRAPSAYHFVGRLGLAVTDALQDHHRASQDKLKELFDSRSMDNRVQILKEHLAKNPSFAEWVNEADPNNVRNGGSGHTLPQWGGSRRFPPKGPFKRP